jgi:hypothetical protein
LKSLDLAAAAGSKAGAGNSLEISVKLNKVLISLHKNRLLEAQKLLSELEVGFKVADLRRLSKYVSAKFYLLYKAKNFKGIDSLFQELAAAGDKSLKSLGLLLRSEIARLLHKNAETLAFLSELISQQPEVLKNEAFAIMILALIGQLPKENSQSAAGVLEKLKAANQDLAIQSLCAEVLEKLEQPIAAAATYEAILTRITEKTAINSTVYKLLRCYSAFDPAKAESLLSKVELPADLITDERELKRLLDKEAGFMSLKVTKAPGSPRSRQSDEILNKPIKQRAKKKRLPKNFDPNKLPDPERWLPLHMRAKFKGKKGKKSGRGAQGEATAGRETVSSYKGLASTANQEAVSSKKATKNKKKRK